MGPVQMRTPSLKTKKLRSGMFTVVNAYRGRPGCFSPSPLFVDPVEEAKRKIAGVQMPGLPGGKSAIPLSF